MEDAYFDSLYLFFFTDTRDQENMTNSNHSETTGHQIFDNTEHFDHQHEEYMSPFLPELDNDTFLHPEHHLIEHNFVPDEHDESSENISTLKPPNLEFDQVNHTNPFDNYTADSFNVIPLNQNVSKENVTISDEVEKNSTNSKSK